MMAAQQAAETQTDKDMTAQATITEASAKLFEAIIKDAGNWGGTPPCYNHINKQTRGNLTQLKRAGLVSTFDSDGDEWIYIEDAGKAEALRRGLGDYIA
jgi:hypothetical protein